MKTLFIALPITSGDRHRLRDVQKETCLGREDKVNLVSEEGFHVTLAYLGKIDEDKIDELKKEMTEELKHLENCSMPARDVIPLIDQGKNVRQLVVRLGYLNDFRKVYRKTMKVLDDAEIEYRRPKAFLLHVTLAILKKKMSLKEFGRVDAARSMLEDFNIPATKVVLYESIPTDDGMKYVSLHEVEFKRVG